MYEYKLVNLAWHSRPDSWYSRSQWNSSSHALDHFPHLGANLICCIWTADSPRASRVCRWAHTLPPMKGDPGDQEPHCSFFHSICTILLHFVNTETWAVYKDELEINAGANIIAFSYSLQSLNCQSWEKKESLRQGMQVHIPVDGKEVSPDHSRQRLVATIKVWWIQSPESRGGAWTSHLLEHSLPLF